MLQRAVQAERTSRKSHSMSSDHLLSIDCDEGRLGMFALRCKREFESRLDAKMCRNFFYVAARRLPVSL